MTIAMSLIPDAERVLSELVQFKGSLQKEENKHRVKIQNERTALEKIAIRQGFYKKLQPNIGPKHVEALKNVERAERALDSIKKEICDVEIEKGKLQSELASIISQKELNVIPELEYLKTLLERSKNEVSENQKLCEDYEQRLNELSSLLGSYAIECDGICHTINERKSMIAALSELKSYDEDIILIESNIKTFHREKDEVEAKKKEVVTEINLQKHRRDELQKQLWSNEEALNQILSKIKIQHQEWDKNMKVLGEERVKQHSLASLRIEIDMNTALAVDGLKHETNFLNSVDKRQLNVSKQSLSKKRQAIVKVKELIQQMHSKLKNLQGRLSVIQGEKLSLERDQIQARSELDQSIAHLLEQEDIDEKQQKQVQKMLKLLADQEVEAERLRSQEKKSSIILAITKEKRAKIRRKIEQARSLKQDIENAIKFEQLMEIDLSKKRKDSTAKSNELSSLHATIEGEKIATKRLIKNKRDVLSNLQNKCTNLQSELRTLGLERDDKVKTLRNLCKDIEASSEIRASNRRDKSLSSTSCRELLEEISMKNGMIDKFKATLALSKKEVGRIGTQNRQMADAKQSLVDQLTERKAQLLSLFNRNNAYTEMSKKGELICLRIEKEIQTAELKNKDIKRSIDIMKSNINDSSEMEEKIEEAKKNLEHQILKTERISFALESPTQERIRTLEGKDPSDVELRQNLSALETLERNNQELLHSKTTAVNEITKSIEKTQDSVNQWKFATQHLFESINDYQGRLRELQRVKTAQLSELQMYASLVDKLNESKVELQRDVSLRENLPHEPKREINTFDAVASSSDRQTKEQRPTAYMPDGDEDNVIRVPRPFGKMAPFKAIEPGSTMRHIRKPQPVPLHDPD